MKSKWKIVFGISLALNGLLLYSLFDSAASTIKVLEGFDLVHQDIQIISRVAHGKLNRQQVEASLPNGKVFEKEKGYINLNRLKFTFDEKGALDSLTYVY